MQRLRVCVLASSRRCNNVRSLPHGTGAGLSNVERIKLDVTDHAAVHVAVDAIVQTAGRLGTCRVGEVDSTNIISGGQVGDADEPRA